MAAPASSSSQRLRGRGSTQARRFFPRDAGCSPDRLRATGALLAVFGLSGGCERDEPPPSADSAAETGDSPSPPPDCDEGEIADGDRCVPEDCGVGTWGDEADADFFVSPSAGAGGDGTAEHPFTTIAEALAAVAQAGGGRVALAEGSYAEQVVLGAEHDGLVLTGRCRELVDIAPGRAAGNGVVWMDARRSTQVTVARVRLHDHSIGVGVGGGKLVLRQVDVEDMEGLGAVVEGAGAVLDLHSVAIRRVEPNAAYGGRGMTVHEGGIVTIDDLTIEEATQIGLDMADVSSVSGSGLTVLSTRDDQSAGYGAAVQVQGGGTLDVEGFTIEDAAFGMLIQGSHVWLENGTLEGFRTAGVLAFGADLLFVATDLDDVQDGGGVSRGLDLYDRTHLEWSGGTLSGFGDAGLRLSSASGATLDGLTVEDASFPTSEGGLGANLLEASWIEATGCTFRRLQGGGIGVYGGSRVDLTNTTVSDTVAFPDGTKGIGIDVAEGSVLVASGGAVTRNRSVGVSATEGADVTLTDVEVSWTTADDAGEFGTGCQVDDGSRLSLHGGLVADNVLAGVYLEGGTVEATGTALARNGVYGLVAFNADTTVVDLDVYENRWAGLAVGGGVARLTNVTVRDTSTAEDGTGGEGVVVLEGATLSMIGGEISGSLGTGLVVDNSSFDISGLTVRDTIPRDSDYGFGVELMLGASGTMRDVTVTGSVAAGVLLHAAGTEEAPLVLDGLQVTDTARGDDAALAVGLMVQEGAVATITGLRTNRTDGLGMLVSEGRITCADCEVRGSLYAGVALRRGNLDYAGHVEEVSGAEEGGGVGIYVADAGETTAPTLLLHDAVVTGAPLAAVYLGGAGRYEILDSELEGGAGDDGHTWPAGHAVVLVGVPTPWDGAAGLRLRGNTLHNSAAAGLLLHGSTATLEGNTWFDNATDLVQQSCGEGLPEPVGWEEEPLETVEICPEYDHWFVPLDLELGPVPE